MTQVLVVGPHPDDQELGMGGTIAKLVDQGHDVLVLDMTNGEPTPLARRRGGREHERSHHDPDGHAFGSRDARQRAEQPRGHPRAERGAGRDAQDRPRSRHHERVHHEVAQVGRPDERSERNG